METAVAATVAPTEVPTSRRRVKRFAVIFDLPGLFLAIHVNRRVA
jgi:hypothetical protein